ncbi:hypothetical protein C3747_4g711 [Trypanosoma cruzi]|uniref:ApaG domain-containing protein n=2 Tax=Trypanosoma cruzi TaxID=5693 RepID=Q4DJ79_TRYCC|nr:hypothetical protein, conserved [Trypanosoma cruzi]EAN92582.1 hypothetical protein, conserved [Trypanosoma cruzi]PWV20893.1 hypothetical protein C3747_4g711 [Trypanosoma cruzi]RNC37521.1 hypothetical protein TcCL_NonESM13308 [Trypanosoma cruzi]|eukprot:XP_814433.1 hypothetical protein [Trypanosoma cruzi strain CL Brener]
MSVERLAYRQILKQVGRASLKYKEPGHVCFAVFGVMLRMDDFAAAGYGNTLQRVARSVFSRPSIAGLASDNSAARLSAAFDVLRRLNDATTSNVKVRERVEGQTENTSHFRSPKGAVKAEKAPEIQGKVTPVESDKSLQGDDDNNNNNNNSNTGVGEEDDVITIANGTIFIEGSVSRKVRKISRHVVFCMVLDRLPLYRFLIPPEPLYTRNMRTSFRFPLIVDALLVMAASSNIPGNVPVVIQNDVRTAEEYRAMCDSISTRTVTVTDHVEVELRAEYVCSRIPDEDVSDVSDDADVHESASRGSSHNGSSKSKEYVFRYVVFIRNYGSSRNPKGWHVQLLSRHWVVFDEDVGQVTEVIGPGVAGNFPLLAPGESHTYESGVSLCGTSGVLRGTFQMNAYNEDGESSCIDVCIGPTRLNAKV